MPRTRKRKNKKQRGGSTKIIREGNNTFTINNKCDGDNSTTIIPECMGPMAVFPAPMLEPFPESAPQPAPQPAPELAPQPAPEPFPESAPQPAPEPFPESAPQPAPEPFPESAPQPAPEPAQEPFPEPAPQPAPQPAKLYTYNIAVELFEWTRVPEIFTYDTVNKKLSRIGFLINPYSQNINNFNVNDTVTVEFRSGILRAPDLSLLQISNYLNKTALIKEKFIRPNGTIVVVLEYNPPIDIDLKVHTYPSLGLSYTGVPNGFLIKEITTTIAPPGATPAAAAPSPAPQPVPEPAPEPAPAPDNPDLIRLTVVELNNLYDSSLIIRPPLEYSGTTSSKTLNFIRLNILEDITNVNINDIVTLNSVNLTIRLNYQDILVTTATLNGTARVKDKNINGNSLGLEYISGNPSVNIPSNYRIDEIVNSSYASGSITVDLLLRIPMPAPAPDIQTVIAIESTSTSIIAGDKVGRFSGDGGSALSASLNKPFGLVYDNNNNLYIADSINQRIRKISNSDGTITTIAGNGNQGNSGDGENALSASFNFPTDLQIKDNNLYVLDTNNNSIRVINLATNIITKFIDNTYTPNPDLFQPQSFKFDSSKDFLYIANTFRNKIIKIDMSTKAVSLVAGDGSPGYTDNIIALSSKLNTPYGIHLDNYDNIYICDTRNNRIRFINAMNGKIYTIAGNGFPGFFGDNGSPLSAKLYNPTNITVDQTYNVIFSDSGNNRIRKIFLNGVPNPDLSVFPEVTAADMAQFYTNGVFNTWPWRGTVYWNYWQGPTGTFNKKVWLTIAGNMPLFHLWQDPTGEGRRDIDAFKKAQDALEQAAIDRYYAIATIAGTGTISYTPDNLDAREISINNPTKLLFNNNNLIFSDTNNHVIRKITPLPVGGRRKYKKKKLFTRKNKLNKRKSNQKKFQ